MPLTFAEGFSVDYYAGGYVLIDIVDGDRVLLLPDGVSLVKGQKPFAVVKLTLDGYGWQTVNLNQTNLPEDPLFLYPEQTFSVESVFVGPGGIVGSPAIGTKPLQSLICAVDVGEAVVS